MLYEILPRRLPNIRKWDKWFRDDIMWFIWTFYSFSSRKSRNWIMENEHIDKWNWNYYVLRWTWLYRIIVYAVSMQARPCRLTKNLHTHLYSHYEYENQLCTFCHPSVNTLWEWNGKNDCTVIQILVNIITITFSSNDKIKTYRTFKRKKNP